MLGRRMVVAAAVAVPALLLSAVPAHADEAPNLAFSVQISHDPAVVGQPVTFTIRSVNNGDFRADPADDYLQIQGFVDGTDGTVSNATPACLHGEIDGNVYNFQCLPASGEQDPGQALGGSFTVRFSHPGTYHLVGAARTEGDSDLSDNFFDETFVVQPAPNPVTSLITLLEQTVAGVLGVLGV